MPAPADPRKPCPRSQNGSWKEAKSSLVRLGSWMIYSMVNIESQAACHGNHRLSTQNTRDCWQQQSTDWERAKLWRRHVTATIMVGTVSVQKSSKHLFTSMNNSPLLDISECQCIGHLETLAVQCPRVISGSCTLTADFFKHPRSKRLMALDSKRNIVSGPLEKIWSGWWNVYGSFRIAWKMDMEWLWQTKSVFDTELWWALFLLFSSFVPLL